MSSRTIYSLAEVKLKKKKRLTGKSLKVENQNRAKHRWRLIKSSGVDRQADSLPLSYQEVDAEISSFLTPTIIIFS